MLDYVIKETELSKGITLSEYINLKGLTLDNWLLIKDYYTGKLITGVRADSLTDSEKDYYVVIVENYIFPQYTEHSERPYYIVVYISKTSVDFIPVVHTSVEVEIVEAPEEENTSEPEYPEEENQQHIEIISNTIEMPLSVFLLMKNQVYDYMDENDLMEKYGDKDIPCGVMVKIMEYSPETSFKCDIYDVFDFDTERQKQEALTIL